MLTSTSPFIMSRDINGFNSFGVVPSTTKYSVTLNSGDVTTVTVPDDSKRYLVIFSIDAAANVWVAYDETAQVPVGNTIVSTTSERNPDARQLLSGTIISMISASTTADVGIVLYSLPNFS